MIQPWRDPVPKSLPEAVFCIQSQKSKPYPLQQRLCMRRELGLERRSGRGEHQM